MPAALKNNRNLELVGFVLVAILIVAVLPFLLDKFEQGFKARAKGKVVRIGRKQSVLLEHRFIDDVADHDEAARFNQFGEFMPSAFLVKAPRAYDLSGYMRSWLRQAPERTTGIELEVDIDPMSFL